MKTINRLYCQSCAIQFDFFSACKKHMYGNEHKQRISELFQTAAHKGPVHFPQFVIQEYLIQPTRGHPIVGLQLVTSCVDTTSGDLPIYLCHLCQDKCTSSQIVFHLISPEHYHAYFAYMNPEKLPFGWISSSEKVSDTRVAADLEERHHGTGVLRVLQLPSQVFQTIKEMPYSQAVKEIYNTDELRQCLEAESHGHVTVQKYHSQPNRTYPLLGLQFFVEYRSTGGQSCSGYLCLLCKKRVRQNQAVAHVISFNHIFWYLDCAHPSSLKSKSSYKVYSPSFRAMILDLAQQAKQLASPGDVQVMNVDPEVFVKVEALSFSNALKELQNAWKEQNLSELQPQVTVGVQLVASSKRKRKETVEWPIKITEGALEEAKSPTGGSDGTVSVPTPKRPKVEQATAEVQRAACRLFCQNCNNGVRYASVKTYKKHVRGYDHKQCIDRQFPDLRRPVRDRGQTRDPVPTLDVYGALMNPNRTDPIIGLHLLTVCITSSANPPVYLCHACGETLSSRDSVRHLTSMDHYFCTVAHDDPESLPFGWLPSHDARCVLRPRVEVEERKYGESVLQVLYLPEEVFVEIRSARYSTAMKTVLRMGDVKASLKVKESVSLPQYLITPKRKYPLLGLQFLVEYQTTDGDRPSEYLCQLCQKRVRQNQAVSHVISFDHIFSYLECMHPLSLGNKNEYKHYDEEYKGTILDLASQAEETDSPGEVREVMLSLDVYEEVCQSSFANALNKLQTAWNALNHGDFRPQVTPGQKLEKKATRLQVDNQKHEDQSVPLQAPGSEKGDEGLSVLNATRLDNRQSDMMVEEKTALSPVATSDPVQESPEIDQVTNSQEAAVHPEPVQDFQQIELDPVEDVAMDIEKDTREELEGGVSHVSEKPTVDAVFAKQGLSECVRASPRSVQDPKRTKTEIAPTKGKKGLHGSRASFQALTYSETGPIGESNWAKFWFLDGRSYPAIGLEAVVECRCLKQPTFYLCLTCTEQIASSHICDHVISSRHQYYYIKSLYPELLRYWRDDPDEVAWLVYRHDRKWDVQGQQPTFPPLPLSSSKVVKLHPASYQRVVSAPFFNAVQMIREEQDQYEPRPLTSLEDEADVVTIDKSRKQSAYAQKAVRADDSIRQIESSHNTFEKISPEMPCCHAQPRVLDLPGGSPSHVQDYSWSPRPVTSPPSTSVGSGDRLAQPCIRPGFSDSLDPRKSLSMECLAAVPLAGADPENPAEKVLITWKEMTGRDILTPSRGLTKFG